jgi:hypothetical protein
LAAAARRKAELATPTLAAEDIDVHRSIYAASDDGAEAARAATAASATISDDKGGALAPIAATTAYYAVQGDAGADKAMCAAAAA